MTMIRENGLGFRVDICICDVKILAALVFRIQTCARKLEFSTLAEIMPIDFIAPT